LVQISVCNVIREEEGLSDWEYIERYYGALVSIDNEYIVFYSLFSSEQYFIIFVNL